MTYYEILGVPEDASHKTITMAYRELAVKYHPDRYDGDPKTAEKVLKQLNVAYSVLCNHEKRTLYDSFLLSHRMPSEHKPEAPAQNCVTKEQVQRTTEELRKSESKFRRNKLKRFAFTALFFSIVFFAIAYFRSELSLIELAGEFVACVAMAIPFVLFNSIIFHQLFESSRNEEAYLEHLRKELQEQENNLTK